MDCVAPGVAKGWTGLVLWGDANSVIQLKQDAEKTVEWSTFFSFLIYQRVI